MKVRGIQSRQIEGTSIPLDSKSSASLRRLCGAKQLQIIITLLLATTGGLIFFLIYLQIYKGPVFQQLAEQNRVRHKEVKPLRGIIYDRYHTPLVVNVPTFNLMVTPIDLYQHPEAAAGISRELAVLFPDQNIDATIKETLSTFSYIPLILKKKITYEQGMRLIPLIEKWPGIFLQEGFERYYPSKDLTAHVVGYTSYVNQQDLDADDHYSGSDIIGKTGVEQTFESSLRGVKGQKQIEVNALGKEDKILNYKPAKRGQDIELSIDLRMQTALDRILKENLIKSKATRAAGVVMNPRNGEVLALVSLPEFDNNIFSSEFNRRQYQDLLTNTDQPLFNRAISGEYPPGSTFKLILGAAALEEGVVTPATTVLSSGGIRVGAWFFPDWLAGGHGVTNMTRAIAWSVNTYFYTIGGGYQDIPGLGLERILAYGAKFNLGQPTGIELPAESAGFLPSTEWKERVKNEPWYLGDTYHLSIGQGDILITPLQVALWTSFFANGGTLYQPTIRSGYSRAIDKNFISSKNTEVIKQGLRETVTSGSARSLNSLKKSVAGKTGTAEIGGDKKPHGWFTGFAPFETPEIVITVLIEEGDGAKSAVPVARDFFNWYFDNY